MSICPVIKISNLTKRFDPKGPAALDNISATIPFGKMTGIVGPDGSGKTTLLRLINGLLKMDKDQIVVDGYDSSYQQSNIHQFTGYMPQKFGLYEDLSVIQNLNLYASLRNIDSNEKTLKFEKLLAFTNLTNFQDRLAGDLSGGMKQKLGLACSLIGNPKLILLDEPTVGVDPLSRRELLAMIKQLVHEGIGVVWSTSYLDEAQQCDQVLVLNQGHLLYQGPPHLFLNDLDEKTFQISGIESSKRRQILMDLIKQPEILDGRIQGESLHLIIKKDYPTQLFQGLINQHQACIKSIKPTFEDGFISALGKHSTDQSSLSNQIQNKNKSSKPIIEVKNLTKKFGDFTAVKNHSFKIHKGEIFGLLGPNGAGKSTTFKMICGLLKPTDGEIYINGLNIRKTPSEAKNKIGYMAQKFSLYDNLTAFQNMEFYSGLYGLFGDQQKKQIEKMTQLFELQDHLNQNARQLPLGFKQRLSLACAIMHEPDVLFLDEPTSGVDPITRREFWMHINALADHGVTIMLTTHFMDEAEYCDRIGLIYQGQTIASGKPNELKESTKSPQLPDPTLEQAFIQIIEQSHRAKT